MSVRLKTLIDTAVDAGTFTMLLAALKAGAFIDTLRAPGPYTVFAPTDEAFGRLTPGALKALLKDTRRLKTVLTCHVVSGTFATRDLKAGELRTVEGSSLIVKIDAGVISVNGSNVVGADLVASNGVIHAIDAVLMEKRQALPAVA